MKTLALGNRLREARKLRGMSQTELSKLIKKSPNQISMIENGQCGASLKTLVSIASSLSVSIDFLAGLVDEAPATRDILYTLREHQARSRAGTPNGC